MSHPIHPTQSLPPNNLLTGFRYLTQGLGLLLQPGMKRFVLIPILANCIVFVILTFFLIQNFSTLQQGFTSFFPDWSWLSYLVAFLTGLFILFILFIYGYSFTILTNLIAAPFYGILAEKIEAHVTGHSSPDEAIGKMVLRTLCREFIKLLYFTTRGFLVLMGLFLLSFIPLLNLFIPIIALLWGTWVMTLQYVDYPADNYQLPFTTLRTRLKAQRLSTISFGGFIMLGSMIPIINIIIMPLAVAGGTLFWVNELRQRLIENQLIKVPPYSGS